MNVEAVKLAEVTHLVAHVQLGDSGVGCWPGDGELALSVGGGESWCGRLSDTALDEAERVWAGRTAAESLTDVEALGVLRAAVDCDAAFYGLTVDWAGARVGVDGLVVRAAARVWSSPVALVGLTERRASVVLELVDMRPTYGAWRLEDARGRLLDEQELVVADLDGPDAESMWDRARTAWRSIATSAGLIAAEPLRLRLSASEIGAGTCGELEVHAAVQ